MEKGITPGNFNLCPRCGEACKFEARKRGKEVIANVYENGKWMRVEHWHSACYTEADCPHGVPVPAAKKVKAKRKVRGR